MKPPSKNITHIEIKDEDDNISELTSVVSAPLPEVRPPDTRLHPSRARQDDDLDDALEYYIPKTKKISGDSADEVDTPKSSSSRDLNNGAASCNVIPGAFRVSPSSLLAGEGNREEQNLMRNNLSEDSSDSKKSMYIIPNASLVETSDHSKTIHVSQEPELVFASPLEVGILPEQHPKNSPSFENSHHDDMELQKMENNPAKLVSGDGAAIKSNQTGVIVVNKRVLWLVLVVSCLAVVGVVSGVAYYVTANKNSDATTTSTSRRPRPMANPANAGNNNGGGGGSGGGSGRRNFLRTR